MYNKCVSNSPTVYIYLCSLWLLVPGPVAVPNKKPYISRNDMGTIRQQQLYPRRRLRPRRFGFFFTEWLGDHGGFLFVFWIIVCVLVAAVMSLLLVLGIIKSKWQTPNGRSSFTLFPLGAREPLDDHRHHDQRTEFFFSPTGTDIIISDNMLPCNLNAFGCIIRPPELTQDIRLDLEEIQQVIGQNVALSYGDLDTAGLSLQGSDHPENQDRGIIISPFLVRSSQDDFMIGIFDGHGTYGHLVSQYLQDHLYKKISQKLSRLDSTWTDVHDNIKKILNESFVEIDRELPEEIGMDGGSTASIILRIGNQLYFANVGDSVSFLAKYDKKTGDTVLVHRNRLDKPNIPEEKIRIEQMGGKVFIPPHPVNSRVVAFNPVRNEMVSLGMSRSIGDWSHGKVGVIAEPVVDVINLDELVSTSSADENVGWLVVSGSDGLFDRRRPQFVAETYSQCFMDPSKCHPAIRTAEIIDSAVPKMTHVYHDDITAMVLRVNI